MKVKKNMLGRLRDIGFTESYEYYTKREYHSEKCDVTRKIYTVCKETNELYIEHDGFGSFKSDNIILDLYKKGYIEDEGCEYCNERPYGKDMQNDIFKKSKTYLYFTTLITRFDGISHKSKINNCPMCGKKLEADING